MSHLPHLIADLALILGAAGLTTLLFRRLKQPVVLGYVLSGLLVGPNLSLFPTVTDLDGIKIWADIGVIFLLFTLGLEFSFKKLAKVGAPAGITGVIEISAMLTIGYMTGRWMGWSAMDSVFLGGVIAISSTTIIFRAFEELGIKTRQFTSLVIGVLIIEDIAAVLLMVLLSTMAIQQEVQGLDLLFAIGKMFFFLTLWFLLGIFLLPTLLQKISKWLTSETLTIVALGLCLGMVVFADRVGLSAALGAFVMGSILSETTYGEKIEHLIASIKNLFGAIFFVSVGMLIDPAVLWTYVAPIAGLSIMVIAGKLLFVSTGSLVAGQPLKQALQAGTAMTQIGEFSFIIATLGLTLGVTGNQLYPIAVGVSVLTTFTTPFMIMMAEPAYHFLSKHLPTSWVAGLDRYSASSQVIKSESDWRIFLSSYVQMMIVNATICVACIIFSRYVVKPNLQRLLDNEAVAIVLSILLSLAIMLPFVWALMVRPIRGSAYKMLWLDSKYNHGPLVMMEILRNMVAVLLIGILLGQHLPWRLAVLGTLVVSAVVWVVFQNRLRNFYQRLEQRFMDNLAARSDENRKPTFTPWDAHMTSIRISPSSGFIGKTLEELALREKYGINIAYIERGKKVIYAPSRYERLYPYDFAGIIGTDQQLQKFTVLVESESDEDVDVDFAANEISLEKVIVDENNRLKGQSIRESGIREKTDGLVVGIERNGERILNPPSNTVFEWEDIVWLVGDRKKITRLYQGKTVTATEHPR